MRLRSTEVLLCVAATLAIAACSTDKPTMPSQPARAVTSSPPKTATARASVDSIVVHTNSGVGKTVPGAHSRALTAGVSQLRATFNTDSLVKLRDALRMSVSTSKERAASVAMMLRIADAVLGPKAEFHSRIAQLPVTIKVSAASKDGRAAVRRDYYVNGVLKLTLFVTAPSGSDEEDGSSIDLPASAGEDALDHPSTTPQVGSSAAATPDYCEYTDYWGNFTAGDCATQEELDDAASTMAALDYEVDDLNTQLNDTYNDYCSSGLHEDPADDTCKATEEDNDVVEPVVSETATASSLFDVTGGVVSFGPEACASYDDGGCAAAVISGTVSVASYALARVGAYGILSGAGATSLAVGVSVGGLILSALGVGLAIGNAINCLMK